MDIKKEQRSIGIAARKALDAETARRFSRIISEKLLAEPSYERARIILSYQAFDGEADPAYFNAYASWSGKRMAYPVCYENGRMAAAIPYTEEDWETGKYGIRAPIEERSFIVEPAEIDLVIVPCAAFDGRSKARTGRGAGYYDRYLPRCTKAAAIAAAFEVQHIQGLHHDPWDIPLDAIITEAGRY
jgi:5-formyltetrahydrofolate cyclo-ligase